MFKVPTQGTTLYVSFPVVQSPTLGLNIDRYITPIPGLSTTFQVAGKNSK